MRQARKRGAVGHDKQRRTLIYKRTHCGDPDPTTGVFGCNNCMKNGVRGWEFDSVIGIGGIGSEAELNGIAGKLTWIGIGKHLIKDDPDRAFVTADNPLVTFDHFKYFAEEARLLETIAPHLAEHMYKRGARHLINLSSDEQKEVEDILRLAENEPPSSQRAGRASTIPVENAHQNLVANNSHCAKLKPSA